MTQIEQIKAKIEQLKNFFKTEREKTTTTDKGMVDKLSFSSKIVVLEELLVFINSLSAEPSEELEDAANIYADAHPGVCHESDGGLFDDYDKPKRDFIAGAKWQKEQLMKNVVETKVKSRIDGKGIFIDTDIPIGIDVNEDDKVKIIIIKEDEE